MAMLILWIFSVSSMAMYGTVIPFSTLHEFISFCILDNRTRHSTCKDGAVKLADGFNEYEGRVEVCISNTWGTVCARRFSWGTNDGKVVCRQLGHQELGTI